MPKKAFGPRDFGAGRSDWGALVALYSRPIEAEVRSHLLQPLLSRLCQLGLCHVKDNDGSYIWHCGRYRRRGNQDATALSKLRHDPGPF